MLDGPYFRVVFFIRLWDGNHILQMDRHKDSQLKTSVARYESCRSDTLSSGVTRLCALSPKLRLNNELTVISLALTVQIELAE